MTKIKKMQFSTSINAPVATVWDTMLGVDTYPLWTAAFIEGSRFEGDWSEGGRIDFLTPSNDGMVAEIAENRPHEFISIRHIGIVESGVEDTESDAVVSWAPAYENYTFESTLEGTVVTIDQDVGTEHEQAMTDTWAKALDSLKKLCETTGTSSS